MVLIPSQSFCMSYNGQVFRCDWNSWQWLMTQPQLTSKHRGESGDKSRKMLAEMYKWRGSLVPLPAHLLLCWHVDAALLGVEIPQKAIIRLLTSLCEVSPIVQMFALLLGLVSGRAGSGAKAFWWSGGAEEGTGSDLRENKVQPLAAVKWKAECVINYKRSSLTSNLGKRIHTSQSSEEHQMGQLPTSGVTTTLWWRSLIQPLVPTDANTCAPATAHGCKWRADICLDYFGRKNPTTTQHSHLPFLYPNFSLDAGGAPWK